MRALHKLIIRFYSFLNKVIFTILNNTIVYQQRLVPTLFFYLMRAVLFNLLSVLSKTDASTFMIEDARFVPQL